MIRASAEMQQLSLHLLKVTIINWNNYAATVAVLDWVTT